MLEEWQKLTRPRTGKSTGIWLAMLLALGLHAVFLLLPIMRQPPSIESPGDFIEVQLTSLEPASNSTPLPLPEPLPLPPEVPQEYVEPPATQLPSEPALSSPPGQAEIQPQKPEPAPLTDIQIARQNRQDLDKMSDPEKVSLTDTILARQYLTEVSAIDQLFGKPTLDNIDVREEFHFPVRPNMLTMLDQPIPDVPFAYTPDLVYFAYDPGVKGDLQRFWDVITPEFGWRTKYGTEVKCILILVIVGCGWK